MQIYDPLPSSRLSRHNVLPYAQGHAVRAALVQDVVSKGGLDSTWSSVTSGGHNMAERIDPPAGQDSQTAAGPQRADSGGLLALYAECGAAVYTLALHITSSPSVAAEITYNVFTAVCAAPHQPNLATGTPRTRLGALTHEWATRASRRSAVGSLSTENPRPTEANLDAQQLARGLALAAQMGGAAGTLDPQQRLALAVTYSAGRTVGDTARILGLSRSTVLRQLTAGLRLLAVEAAPPSSDAGAQAPRHARRAPVRTATATLRSVLRLSRPQKAPSTARHRRSPPRATG